MKKSITHLTYLGAFLFLMLNSQANAQTGCHALFGFHQTTNTLTVNFTDSSTSAHTITSWLWNFGDGNTSTLQNPHHTYNHAGTYNVCLTIHDASGCSHTSCHTITVNPIVVTCHAGFTFHVDSSGATFTNTSTGTGPNTTYLWQFGDGSSSTSHNPQHTYIHTGHYNVCLFINDSTTGCQSHSCHWVNYHHKVHHQIQAVASLPVMKIQSSDDSGNEQYINSFPNPFNESATVKYELTEDANVKIEVFNLIGSTVSQLKSEQQQKGQQAFIINGNNLPSGLYFIKMSVNDQSFTKKITVEK